MGSSTWSVQFHPDFGRDQISELVRERAAQLGTDTSGIVLDQDDSSNRKIMVNFLDFVRQN